MALRSLAKVLRWPFFLLLTAPVVLAVLSAAQASTVPGDFSVTLERTGCVGSCPGYTVTVLADGSVRYDGKYYVRAMGVRRKTIPLASVDRLAQLVRDGHLFDCAEKKAVCLDFPEVRITVVMNGQKKHVLEGCNEAGDILTLAQEIDTIAGTQPWVGHVQ